MKTNPPGVAWIKSSYSTTDENCVEVACVGEAVLVRDSKEPRGGALCLSRAAFGALCGSRVFGAR